MQPFFTSILTTTFGGQFAPKKGGQFDRIFHFTLKISRFQAQKFTNANSYMSMFLVYRIIFLFFVVSKSKIKIYQEA
jgi:hypothetical protein